jgi:hypothetical protein
LSLCDSATQGTIQVQVRQVLFAAIIREALKTGSSKSEKAALKDFVKALSLVNPGTWINPSLMSVVNSCIGYVFKITTDKASLKILEKLAEECEVVEDVDLSIEEVSRFISEFYAAAPGLADLMEMSSGPDGDVSDLCQKVNGSMALSSKLQENSKPSMNSKSDGDDCVKSTRPGRVSTVLTHSTIYTQKHSLLSNDETAQHAVEDAADTTHTVLHTTP